MVRQNLTIVLLVVSALALPWSAYWPRIFQAQPLHYEVDVSLVGFHVPTLWGPSHDPPYSARDLPAHTSHLGLPHQKEREHCLPDLVRQ